MRKFKTFYQAQTTRHIKEIVQPMPPQTKASYVSGTKIFLWRFTGICRYLLSKCLVNAVLGRLEMVQCKCFF